MTQGPAPGLYRCTRERDFELRRFNDGVAVYDEADGSVHALSPLAGEVWGFFLEGRSFTPSTLAKRLQLESPSEAELTQVQALMEEFVSMGFVERVVA